MHHQLSFFLILPSTTQTFRLTQPYVEAIPPRTYAEDPPFMKSIKILICHFWKVGGIALDKCVTLCTPWRRVSFRLDRPNVCVCGSQKEGLRLMMAILRWMHLCIYFNLRWRLVRRNLVGKWQVVPMGDSLHHSWHSKKFHLWKCNVAIPHIDFFRLPSALEPFFSAVQHARVQLQLRGFRLPHKRYYRTAPLLHKVQSPGHPRKL